MAGVLGTFTLAVTTKHPQYLFLRLKMEIALGVIPLLSGKPTDIGLRTILQCCSTFLANVNSSIQNIGKRYILAMALVLLLEMVGAS